MFLKKLFHVLVIVALLGLQSAGAHYHLAQNHDHDGSNHQHQLTGHIHHAEQHHVDVFADDPHDPSQVIELEQQGFVGKYFNDIDGPQGDHLVLAFASLHANAALQTWQAIRSAPIPASHSYQLAQARAPPFALV